MHNQPREPQPYEDRQAKSIQEFGWTSQGMTEAGIKASRATTHRRVKEFGYSCRIPLFKPLKGVAVYRVLYQSILNAKLTGRKNLGRKRCTSNRDDRKLENTVKQSWFKHLWEHQESPRSDVFRKRATKPLLNQRQRQKHLTWAVEKKNWTVAQWSKVLFSDESKFCISFGNQGPRVWRKSGEAQNPCCLKSSVKFPQSVMIWAAMSSAGVGPLCFLKSTVNAAIYQEILEHFMLPSADKLYGDADFIFQQDLAPAHTAKGTKSWFNDHGVTVLDWPANSPDLNPIENLWGIVKRKMRDTRPNNADELKATVKETWASIPPQQCHKLITSMPRRIEAVIKAKGAPTKYWVHIQ